MDLTKTFLTSVQDNLELKEALDIIHLNSESNYWIIGGFVFRNIVSKLYNSPRKICDIDIIAERPVKKLTLPSGWVTKLNNYGNPIITKDNRKLDFVPLQNISSIKRRGLAPTIDNYLTGTPLTVQSIAFDVNKNQIIGEIGTKAILDKVVAVNDLEEAKIESQNRNKSINELLLEKASELGFRAITI